MEKALRRSSQVIDLVAIVTKEDCFGTDKRLFQPINANSFPMSGQRMQYNCQCPFTRWRAGESDKSRGLHGLENYFPKHSQF